MIDTTHDAGYITLAEGTCLACKRKKLPCWTVDGRSVCSTCAVNALAPRAGMSVRFGGLAGQSDRPVATNDRAA